MDHQDKHHEHHKKQREHEDKIKKEHEHQQERLPRKIHPAWFVIVGSVLIILVILIWSMV